MRRRGIASIVGTLFFALTFLAAIGSLAYLEGVQTQYNNAVQSSLNLQSQHQRESLAYQPLTNGTLYVQNNGASSSQIVATILRFANGSVYEFPASASVGSSNLLAVAGLIPNSNCGLSTCLSKYDTILASTDTGNLVGLVTSLGNVFWYGNTVTSSLPSQNLKVGSTWKSFTNIGANDAPSQIYQNPSDPTRFYLSSARPSTRSPRRPGGVLWSFDAGQGEVTDVLPLSDGGVYVSDGYYGDQFTSTSSRLVVLRDLGHGLHDEAAAGSTPRSRSSTPTTASRPTPWARSPSRRGRTASTPTTTAGSSPRAGSHRRPSRRTPTTSRARTRNQFYLYIPSANPGGFGCSNPRGNVVTIYAYSANAQGVQEQWSTTSPSTPATSTPTSSRVIGGLGRRRSLFSQTYWTQPTYYGGPYPGANPYLAVLSSSSGAVLYSNYMDQPAYSSSLVTDGTYVYLGVLGSNQIERVTISSGAKSFYATQVPPASSSIPTATSSRSATTASRSSIQT